MNKIYLISSIFVLTSNTALLAQGFGLGQSSPTEALHISTLAANTIQNAAVRLDCQTNSSTSSANFANGNTPTNDATVGSLTWGSLSTTVPNIAASGSFSSSSGNTGTTQYLKYVNSNGNFAAVSGTIQGILVTVNRKRTNAASQVAILDAWASSSSNGNVGSFSTSAVTVSAGTNRLLLAVVQLSDNGSQNISTVTYGSTTMTAAGSEITSGNINQEFFYLNDAGLTTEGSGQTINVTWTGGGNVRTLNVSYVVYQYVNQTTPTTSFQSNTSTSSPTSLSVSSAVSYSAGDMVVAAMVADVSDGTKTQPTGFNERVDATLTNSVSGAWGVADLGYASASTVSPGWSSVSNSNNNFIVSALSVQFNATTVYDNSVRLYKAGSVVGNDKAATSTLWPTAAASTTYGSSTDLWGQSWTASDIQNAGFGVGISAVCSGATAGIDQILITVYYVPSGNYTNYVAGIQYSTGNFLISQSTAFGTNDYFTIKSSNGNVGIGSITPGYKLDVQGGDINASGSVRSAGAALTSDARLKSNVLNLDNGLNTIMQLRPVSYLKKANLQSTDYNKNEIGFIAQEVQKILPQLVSEGNDADKILALDYNSLIPVLTKAIQEQQKMIEQLNNKIVSLSEMAQRMKVIEARLNQLEPGTTGYKLKPLQFVNSNY